VWNIGTTEYCESTAGRNGSTSNSTVTLRFFANVLSFPPVTGRRRRGKTDKSVLHHQIEGHLSSPPAPYHDDEKKGSGGGNFDRKTRIAQLTRDRNLAPPTGLGAPQPMDIHMSRYHTTVVSGLGLRPQMGIVHIVMCERRDKNDVIGCEYGHLRLIDLYIAIGCERRGKVKKN
jgi:hypothetical protein